MSNSPERSPPKHSYPLSGNTVEKAKSLQQKQNHHQQEQPHPVSAGIFPEQDHKKDKFQQTNQSSNDHNSQQRQQTPYKVPSQPSATWVSPIQEDDYSKPLLGGQSGQERQPHFSSDGVASKNVSYEEFVAREGKESLESLDPETGFPKCWPKVSAPPAPAPVPVSAPPEEILPLQVKEKASPQNVPKTLPPPAPPSAKVASPAVDPYPPKDFPQPNASRTDLLPSPSPATVPAPSVEQPSQKKVFPPVVKEKASEQNVPSPSPPPRSRGCCIIL